MAFHRPWYEVQFGGVLGIENQIPEAYTRVVEGFRTHYTDVLTPDDYTFHTIHIYVDEEHGSGVGAFAERYLDTEEKRRSARSAYLTGAELTRRCSDAARRRELVAARHGDAGYGAVAVQRGGSSMTAPSRRAAASRQIRVG